MNHASASSTETDPPPPNKPTPGETKPGARPGSDPEKKNDAPGAVRKEGDGKPHPTEIDRSTDA